MNSVNRFVRYRIDVGSGNRTFLMSSSHALFPWKTSIWKGSVVHDLSWMLRPGPKTRSSPSFDKSHHRVPKPFVLSPTLTLSTSLVQSCSFIHLPLFPSIYICIRNDWLSCCWRIDHKVSALTLSLSPGINFRVSCSLSYLLKCSLNPFSTLTN